MITHQDQNEATAPDVAGSELTPLLAGDYVLATKYSDGDPQDQWSIGFFDSMLPKVGGERYMVVDGEGNQFRGNGFRRAQKIDANTGRWLLEHKAEIESSGRSVWDWLDFLSDS